MLAKRWQFGSIRRREQWPSTLLSLCVLSLCVFAVSACGGDSGDGTPVADAGASNFPIQLRGTCDQGERIGGFRVFSNDRFSGITGEVRDGVLPTAIRDVVMESGDCKLLRPPTLFCDPGCAAAEECSASGTCIPRPVRQDIGQVTITGLEEPIVMDVRSNNDYGANPAANPVFGSTAEVRLQSTDGDVGVVQLGGYGFEPLALPTPDLLIQGGTDLAVAWTPRTTSDFTSTVSLDLLIDQHGTSRTRLVCEFPDTGSGTVASALIDTWLSEGVSGFPNGMMARRTVDKVSVTDGCFELEVEYEVTNTLAVDGFTPCNSTPDCPGDQICDVPNQTCVDP